MGTRLAEGLAAALLLLWLNGVWGEVTLSRLDTSWITYLILAGAIGWVIFTLKLSQAVKQQSRLETRPREPRPDLHPPDS